MLKPRKNKWFEGAFALYNRNLLRRRFESFRLRGLDDLAAEPARSRIIFANHTTWWDGLIAFEVSRRAGLDAFVMMEERQLRRYRLFRMLGAFSIERASPRSAVRSLGFAANLLRSGPPKALWIFPQGEIRPASQRPLGLRGGLAAIVRRTPEALVIPFAIRCEFGGTFKPDIYAEAGRALACSELLGKPRKELTAELESRLEALVSGLDESIEEGNTLGFEEIIR